jgi:S-DNA-T family DNA segregation ATPase FtsK/SpoIIIE
MAQQRQTRQPEQRGHWTPLWVGIVAALAAAAIAFSERLHVLPITPWGLPLLGVGGAAATVVLTLVQQGWVRTHVVRSIAWISAGIWEEVAVHAFHAQIVWWTLIGGASLFAIAAHVCRTPDQPTAQTATGAATPAGTEDVRPPRIRRWEATIRHNTGKKVVVRDVIDWAIPTDGQNVVCELPASMTRREIADPGMIEKLQSSCHLPEGCVIRVLKGAHQGEAVLSVMLRDCLVDEVTLDEDITPVSINTPFPVMVSPEGEQLEVCLREQSMVIGGTTGSGKTTLLHRIIMWLARCVDALIWVVDLNGGGLAEPWIYAWANEMADRPTVDWVADNEAEAAVLVAVATASAKDRKTNPEATRRKRAADSMILPVDEKMPAIIVLTDEGGEVRQAVSVLGQLVATGITRLAQIGRAEAGRIIMSILRGTADLLDRNLKVNAAIRICLRMQEPEEYDHVLGANPGRAQMLHKGSAYLMRGGVDPRPIFGRTVNIKLSGILEHSIATADLRPELDDRARRVAAKLRPKDVMGGRTPDAETLALSVMQDVLVGRAYEGRWDRYAPRLAQMRGEELPELEDDDEPEEPTAPVATSVGGPALAALAMAAGLAEPAAPKPAATAEPKPSSRSGVDLDDHAQVNAEADRMLATASIDPAMLASLGAISGSDTITETSPKSKVPANEHILTILTEAYPDALSSDQIGERLGQRAAGINRTYRQAVLKQMKTRGEIVQPSGDNGPYTVPPK